ncbi:MAG: hypothetical protein LBH62_01785 [Nitrososphaerota archaeon]|jgi:hypothetical protein|nr:hypothetical protein [Nitrososphaerota archaeon]
MFKVLGTSSGGGSGGCDCDWNDVPFINLKGNMYLDAATVPIDTKKQFIEVLSVPHKFTNWASITGFLR